MSETDALDLVRRAFHEAFQVAPEQLQTSNSPADIDGWDSLGHVKLVGLLEEASGVQFEVDEIMDMEDVAAIVHILQKHLGV